MHKGRMEAFSDGVIAIIITVMVLEFKVPRGDNLSNLIPLLPTIFTYVISFVYLGIYWNNHHHMLSAVDKVNGASLWANLHLLFWLSLIPFATNWMGDSHFTQWPVILYGFILFMNGVAYYILSRALLLAPNPKLKKALGNDIKGIISLVIYILSIGMGFINPTISIILFICVGFIWFIPDKRMEHTLISEEKKE